jgi:hypothetical protein
MNEMKFIVNGTTYVIEEYNGNYQYFKMENGQKKAPTMEELNQLFEKIREVNNKKYTKEEIIEKINEAIKEKKLTKSEDIKSFLLSLNVTEDFEELENYAKQQLRDQKIEITPVDELREKILNDLDNISRDDIQAFLSFNCKKSNVSIDYLEIEMMSKKDNEIHESPKMYCMYNEETKTKLIEPVIAAVVEKDQVITNRAQNTEDSMAYTADYSLKTKNNNFIDVKDIDRDYAKYLQQKVEDMHRDYQGDVDKEETEELTEEQKQEMNLNRDQVMRLVRKKKENSNQGFTSAMLIFIVTEIISFFLIAFQLFFARV